MIKSSTKSELQPGGSWPMFHHDPQHTGRGGGGGAVGTLKWKLATGNASSSPAIGCDGTVYVGSEDGNLYAVNPDGSMKWKFATGDVEFSSPAVGSDGTIHIGCMDHNLCAVNPDGSMKWKFATGDIVTSSPAIDSHGTVYVPCDSNLVDSHMST